MPERLWQALSGVWHQCVEVHSYLSCLLGTVDPECLRVWKLTGDDERAMKGLSEAGRGRRIQDVWAWGRHLHMSSSNTHVTL